MKKMLGTFSLVGLDTDDVESMERAWNDWVSELSGRGLKPAEEPISFTDTSLTYTLLPLPVVFLTGVS